MIFEINISLQYYLVHSFNESDTNSVTHSSFGRFNDTVLVGEEITANETTGFYCIISDLAQITCFTGSQKAHRGWFCKERKNPCLFESMLLVPVRSTAFANNLKQY